MINHNGKQTKIPVFFSHGKVGFIIENRLPGSVHRTSASPLRLLDSSPGSPSWSRLPSSLSSLGRWDQSLNCIIIYTIRLLKETLGSNFSWFFHYFLTWEYREGEKANRKGFITRCFNPRSSAGNCVPSSDSRQFYQWRRVCSGILSNFCESVHRGFDRGACRVHGGIWWWLLSSLFLTV